MPKIRWLGKISHSITNPLLEVIYPSYCEACKRRIKDSILCKACLDKLELVKDHACLKCGAEISPSHRAKRCKSCVGKRMTFAGCVALGKYQGLVRELVISLKFKSKKYIAKFLGAHLAEKLRMFARDWDMIVPVPSARSIFSSRRYNQAEVLAHIVANELRLPIETKGLIKTRKTKPQVELALEERVRNPIGAFTVKSASKFRGKVILLIDDVLTTGATASECADAIKRAGASEVYLAVAARD